MKFLKRVIAVATASLIIASSCFSAGAEIVFNGENGGDTNSTLETGTKYFVYSGVPNVYACGYRFSVVNSLNKVDTGTKVMDILCHDYEDADTAINAYRFDTKLNKFYLKEDYASATSGTALSISAQNDNVSWDKDKLLTNLPADFTQIAEVTKNSAVLAQILTATNCDVKYTELGTKQLKVIVEPLFLVQLDYRPCAFTPTEIAMYAKCNGQTTNQPINIAGDTMSWQYIARFTNQRWPKSICINDSAALTSINNAFGAADQSNNAEQLSFDDIVNKAYGVGFITNYSLERRAVDISADVYWTNQNGTKIDVEEKLLEGNTYTPTIAITNKSAESVPVTYNMTDGFSGENYYDTVTVPQNDTTLITGNPVEFLYSNMGSSIKQSVEQLTTNNTKENGINEALTFNLNIALDGTANVAAGSAATLYDTDASDNGKNIKQELSYIRASTNHKISAYPNRIKTEDNMEFGGNDVFPWVEEDIPKTSFSDKNDQTYETSGSELKVKLNPGASLKIMKFTPAPTYLIKNKEYTINFQFTSEQGFSENNCTFYLYNTNTDKYKVITNGCIFTAEMTGNYYFAFRAKYSSTTGNNYSIKNIEIIENDNNLFCGTKDDMVDDSSLFGSKKIEESGLYFKVQQTAFLSGGGHFQLNDQVYLVRGTQYFFSANVNTGTTQCVLDPSFTSASPSVIFSLYGPNSSVITSEKNDFTPKYDDSGKLIGYNFLVYYSGYYSLYFNTKSQTTFEFSDIKIAAEEDNLLTNYVSTNGNKSSTDNNMFPAISSSDTVQAADKHNCTVSFGNDTVRIISGTSDAEGYAYLPKTFFLEQGVKYNFSCNVDGSGWRIWLSKHKGGVEAWVQNQTDKSCTNLMQDSYGNFSVAKSGCYKLRLDCNDISKENTSDRLFSDIKIINPVDSFYNNTSSYTVKNNGNIVVDKNTGVRTSLTYFLPKNEPKYSSYTLTGCYELDYTCLTPEVDSSQYSVYFLCEEAYGPSYKLEKLNQSSPYYVFKKEIATPTGGEYETTEMYPGKFRLMIQNNSNKELEFSPFTLKKVESGTGDGEYITDQETVVDNAKNDKVYSGERLSLKVKITARSSFYMNYAIRYDASISADPKTAKLFAGGSVTIDLVKNSDSDIRLSDLTQSEIHDKITKTCKGYAIGTPHNISTRYYDILQYSMDLEAVSIIMKDATTNKTITEFNEGQSIYLVSTYRNNSGIDILMSASLYHRSNNTSSTGNISNSLAIPAKSTTTLTSDTFVASSAFTATAKVYEQYYFDLGNPARYESNPNNNVIQIAYTAKGDDVKISENLPNARYRKGTNVSLSFNISNLSSIIYDQNKNSKVQIIVKDSKGVSVLDKTETLICPANATTLVWTNWLTPTVANGTYNVAVYFDNDLKYSRSFELYDVLTVNTPDTTYTPKAPSWYNDEPTLNSSSFLALDTATTDTNSDTWSKWYFENGSFVQKTFSASFGISSVITPVGSPTATKDADGNWTMRSGYGFKLNTVPNISGNGASDCTGAQHGISAFPEFENSLMTTMSGSWYHNSSYKFAEEIYIKNSFGSTRFGFKNLNGNYSDFVNNGEYGTFASLTMKDGKFELPFNDTFTTERVHFTPIWYPDGDYKLSTYVYDVWTPGGKMLSGFAESNSIQIQGTMFDDYYILGQ